MMVCFQLLIPKFEKMTRMGKVGRTAIAAMVFTLSMPALTSLAQAQNRKERKQARLTESEKPRDIQGGVSFSVQVPAANAFDAAVKFFQMQDIALDESSRKEMGQLVTAMRIVDVGGFRNNNKGYRTYVTFIRDNESATTVKLKVTVQQRTKHVQAEPWTDPTVLDKETAETAEQLKRALTAP